MNVKLNVGLRAVVGLVEDTSVVQTGHLSDLTRRVHDGYLVNDTDRLLLAFTQVQSSEAGR